MTEHDLESYYDEFGARLTRATPPPRPARHRRPIALAAALAVTALVAAAIVFGGSGNRLDPVAEARAALASPGEIVYMKITSRIGTERSGSAPAQTTEQWSALDPPRWRFVQTFPPPGGPNPTFGDENGPIVRQEVSYANGERRSYIAGRDTLDVNQGLNDDHPAARVPSPLGRGSGDLQTDLRSMLAGGEVTDQGEQQVNGRTVRRLVSEQRKPLGVGKPPIATGQGPDPKVWRRLVYDVDPDTFAPIDVTLTVAVASSDGSPPEPLGFTSRLHVDAYERIPLSDTTAKLLEIQTTPQTKVTVHTAKERRERQERMRKRCRSSKNCYGPLPRPPKRR